MVQLEKYPFCTHSHRSVSTLKRKPYVPSCLTFSRFILWIPFYLLSLPQTRSSHNLLNFQAYIRILKKLLPIGKKVTNTVEHRFS